MAVVVYKKVGETPLESLEQYRAEQIVAGNAELAGVPMTYAGRLDPMAEGKLIILIGEECKNKDDYLALDKEYELEILFGLETDTQDVLGKITHHPGLETHRISINNVETIEKIERASAQEYVGIFLQKYPAYSSKTVDGKALHTHAKEGTLPSYEELPEREVEIYDIEVISKRTMIGADIARDVVEKIRQVKGDFRQDEIVSGWEKFGQIHAKQLFPLVKIRVQCSSGTYMRTLAETIGKDIGSGAIAHSINRTKIGDF